MTTITDRISQREEWVVASLLDNLHKPWGPCLAYAVAHHELWENPIARKLAKAIANSISNLTMANIARKLGREDSKWLRRSIFYENGLPLDIAEYEAHDLCVYYRGKRLAALVGDAWTRLGDHPEQGKCIAESLRSALEEYV